MKARKMATPTKRMSGVTLRGHALQTLHLLDRDGEPVVRPLP